MNITINIPDKNTKEIREAVDNFNTTEEIEKMNAVCFWLIKKCSETNSTKMTIKQEKVTCFGEDVGNFTITIKKYN